MGRARQEKLRWGLIGTGRHAEQYIAPAMQASATSRLQAVFDVDLGRAQALAQKYEIPSVYDSLDALLADKNIQAVYIITPNHLHREHVTRAAQAGKHILCEKPMAPTVDDTLAMVEACSKARVKLGIGFNQRHNPVHAEVKKLVEAGAIGQPLYAEIQYMHVTAGTESKRQMPTWRADPKLAGGGSFMGTGVHIIDLLPFMLGRRITHLLALADAAWYTSQSENVIQASLHLEGNLAGSLAAGRMRYPLNDLAIFGSTATIHCTGSLGNYGGGRLELVSDRGSEVKDFEKSDSYLMQLEAFAASLAEGREPNASGYDGVQGVAVTEALYQSLRTRTVTEVRKI